MGIIKDHATSKLEGSTLTCQGTSTSQIGDILADALLLVPYYMKGIGFVSLGAYIQGKAVYKKHKEDLLKLDRISLVGHSLGGGVSTIVLLMLLRDEYKKPITLFNCGSIKVLSSKARIYIAVKLNSFNITWKVHHKDIVPFLGWWKEPLHHTDRTGEERKNIFNWDWQEHLNYWR